jgi:hypothetical protein
MCKTNVKMDLYYVNICKHEKNMTRLWYKIVPKTIVEQIERNEVLFQFIPFFWGLNSRKFPKRLLCVHQVRNFFEEPF